MNWGQEALSILADREPILGRDLRGALADRGWRGSVAAFYSLMSRLEDDGLVNGRWMQRDLYGHVFRERGYTLTALGQQCSH